jgi:hypothetical protein
MNRILGFTFFSLSGRKAEKPIRQRRSKHFLLSSGKEKINLVYPLNPVRKIFNFWVG